MTATDTTITPAPLGRTAPVITINGTAMSVAQLDALLSVRIEAGLCVPARLTLRFADVGHAIAKSGTYKLNTAIVVKIESTQIIKAYVTGIHASRNSGDFAEYVVTADDQSFKLGRGIVPTIYLAQTYSDAITAMASPAGLTASVSGTAFPSGQVPYQMRTGTAMSYLNLLCRRNGAYWWVSGSDGRTLYVKAATENVGTASKNVNDDMLDFSLRASGLRPTAVEIDSWDPVAKAAVTGSSTTPASRGTAPTLVSSHFGNVSDLGDAKSSFGSYNPKDADDAGGIAKGLLNDAADGSVIARGMCFADPSLAPGVKLTIANSDIFNGDYFISEVEHTYSNKGFYTKFVAGPHRTTTLVDTLGRVDEDPGLNVGGLMVAKVSDTKETENTSLGRVKVQFLAQPGQTPPDSAWARVISMGAGANRGMMFHPEVGDEVIVGFEQNDIRRPVVLGGVWTGTDANPIAASLPDSNKKVSVRQIASFGGHIIEFGEMDPQGGQAGSGTHLKFTVKGGPVLRLGGDETTLTLDSGKPLTITAGSAKITVDKQGNVAINTDQGITLKATQDVSIEGQNVKIKGNLEASIEGGTKAGVKGAQVEVNGSAQTAIKGGMVQIN